jgi:hypothetical protein
MKLPQLAIELTLSVGIRPSTMMHFGSARFSLALLLGGMGIFSAHLISAEASVVAGTWRGKSVCVTETPACHNESVVYRIKDIPDHPDLVLIQADKIVDGKAIPMGTGQWQYDRTEHTLE